MTQLSVETERLIIRPIKKSDYTSFVDGFSNCMNQQNRFDEGKFDTSFMTPDWYEKLLLRRETESSKDYSYMFNVFLKEDNTSVGYCNITPHVREDFQYARIGYTIFNNYWGIGYATEVIQGLIKLGFEPLNLHRLEAHVNLDNKASKRALIKAGFTFECVRKAFILEDGIWTDNEIYYINNDAWVNND